MSFLNNLICSICYLYMKKSDPEWTKQTEEKYKYKEQKQYREGEY